MKQEAIVLIRKLMNKVVRYHRSYKVNVGETKEKCFLIIGKSCLIIGKVDGNHFEERSFNWENHQPCEELSLLSYNNLAVRDFIKIIMKTCNTLKIFKFISFEGRKYYIVSAERNFIKKLYSFVESWMKWRWSLFL